MAYQAPELRDHGTVEELTLASSSGSIETMDGPTTYGPAGPAITS